MFANLVQDLLNMQGEVQQHAPSLSNTWGYLAAQGKALLAGSYASVTQDKWVTQYRAFLQQLTGMDTSTSFLQAAYSGGTTEAAQTLSDSVAALPANISAGVQNVAATVGSGVGTFAGTGTASFFSALSPYLPWIVLGVAGIVLVPMLLGEKK